MTKNDIQEIRNLNLQLEQKKARKAEIKKLITEHRDSFTDAQINENLAEAKKLKEDISNLEQKIKDADTRAANEGVNMNYLENQQEIEERANNFVKTNRMSIRGGGQNSELRTELLSSGTLKPLSNQVNINDVANSGLSTILDDIYIQDLYGLGGNEIPYTATESTAAEGTEGEAPTESEPEFGIIKTTPVTVNTIAYVSRRIKKLSPVQYEQKVRELALKALRKEVIKLVLTGEAGSKSSNDITVSGVEGIGNSALNSKLEISTAIGPTTLRDIVLNYGGDDEVSGAATLLLCKKDLQAFGAVRGTNEKKAVYEITIDENNPNAGTIKDGGTIVRFKINSNLTENNMIYGQLPHYELDTFGDYEVTTSEDFKFDKGLIAIKGEVDVAGAVTAKGGFMTITMNKAD